MAGFFQQINVWIWLGIVLQMIGRVLERSGSTTLGLIATILGAVSFLIGCAGIAQEKGYSKWLGLLGLLSCLGLLVLLLLPEK